MTGFKDKTAVITGAGSGIGEAIAYQFALRGAKVVLAGRNTARLEAVSAKCASMGAGAFFHAMDAEDPLSIENFASYLRENGLMPDFLVLNAGISQRGAALESDLSVDRRIMEVNYFGAVSLTKALGDHLRTAKKVNIAVTTSISGLFGFPLRSAYCASKHALFGFFESLETEYPNIRVTFLIPGRINTGISEHSLTADGRPYGKMDPGQANGMSVEKCAVKAIKAIGKEKRRKLIGGKELLMVQFHRFCPSIFFRLARKVSPH